MSNNNNNNNFLRIKWIDRIPGYHYYDTPDGEDCLRKVIFMNKLGLVFGAFAGTMDVVVMTKPTGFVNIAARYACCSFPMMAVGSTFAATSCLLTNYRGVNDTWNYSIGGFAAGCVAGACFKSGTFGTFAAVALGALGYVNKSMEEGGYEFWPEDNVPYQWGGIWSVGRNAYDFTLTKDNHPKGWKKAEDL